MDSTQVKAGYQVTELGVIPEDWEVKQIRDVCKLINGRGFKPYEWQDFGLPIIRIQNLNGSDEFNYFDGSYDKKIEVYNGQLLFAWSGSRGTSFGPHIWNGTLGLLNYHTWKVEVFESVIDKNYFLFALKQLTNFIENKAHGASALVHTQKWEMEGFHLLLPPLPEQKAIAAALSDVDALISAQEALIAKKRDIKTATMQQLLTGKVRLVNNGQRTGDSGKRGTTDNGQRTGDNDEAESLSSIHSSLSTNSVPPGYQQTELGVIPEDWDVLRFEELAFIRNEKVNPKVFGGGEYCIELEHISQGTGTLLGHTETTSDSSIKARFRAGDILFGKLRAYLRKYWLADCNGVASTEIWPIVSQPNSISEFLFQVIQTDLFIESASTAYGTHMPRSDWNVIKNFPVATPPLSEQKAIAEVLSDMDAEITALEAQRDKTRAIKQGMMQELLTGKTRLVDNGREKTDNG